MDALRLFGGNDCHIDAIALKPLKDMCYLPALGLLAAAALVVVLVFEGLGGGHTQAVGEQLAHASMKSPAWMRLTSFFGTGGKPARIDTAPWDLSTPSAPSFPLEGEAGVPARRRDH